MVHVSESSDSSKHNRSNGFLVAITAVFSLLAKRASRLKSKPKFAAAKTVTDGGFDDDDWKIELRTPPPKSPLAAPKKLLSNISSKALLPFGHHNQKKKGSGCSAAAEGGWGDGGVWQKEILMGGKCEPLDFSGVIYYDINGKQVSEVPLRSPRASPLPGYLTRPTQEAH
ncbi:hypothetical protein HN51_036027 [Arachis hypogaea]|uniref:Uncharacterized protein n=1 Tax=Arachis hypogaea TaxID=3818 RepID=A0A445A1W9_ARAHY|nr:uncharacterized protein LOC107630412 [Arachis ipaensis]XP_025644419.1 uncharacterized protein LOC112738267 [Arachis hypogaea]QHO01290.1 Transmembrane protein, putative [Arachis hypogaea]RYR20431.1 hypothetical protein Ahy_B03g065548 [Arachis hypogaea]